eukprot:123789-Alexandrium_andersonii.AAC.1
MSAREGALQTIICTTCFRPPSEPSESKNATWRCPGPGSSRACPAFLSGEMCGQRAGYPSLRLHVSRGGAYRSPGPPPKPP